MGAKIQAFDIFQTPLSSHYPLPLNYMYIKVDAEMAVKEEKKKQSHPTIPFFKAMYINRT